MRQNLASSSKASPQSINFPSRDNITKKVDDFSISIKENRSGRFDVEIKLTGELGAHNVKALNIKGSTVKRLKSALSERGLLHPALPEGAHGLLAAIEAVRICTRESVKKEGKVNYTEGIFNHLSDKLDAMIKSMTISDAAALIEVNQITPKIVEVHLPTRSLLCAFFLRMQEHYESPYFKDKTFTREQFKTWYAKNQSEQKEFTYYFDWSGFNFPARIVAPFKEGRFFPLSMGERVLLWRISQAVDGDLFYVIGTGGDKNSTRRRSTLDHEIRHGLYSTDKVYKRESDKITDKLSIAPLCNFLKRVGYDRSVWLDECQAYLGGDMRELSKRTGHNFDTPEYRMAARKLKKLQEQRTVFQRRLGE